MGVAVDVAGSDVAVDVPVRGAVGVADACAVGGTSVGRASADSVVAAGGAEGDDAAVIFSGTAEGVDAGASGAQAAKTTIRINSVRLKRFVCFMFMASLLSAI